MMIFYRTKNGKLVKFDTNKMPLIKELKGEGRKEKIK